MNKDQPKTIGAFLDAQQVGELARTIYNRFQYEYGFQPQWLDDINKPLRDTICKRVKEVLDALAINGYTLTFSEEDKNVRRQYLTKATPFGSNGVQVPKKRGRRKAEVSELPADREGQGSDGSGNGNVCNLVGLSRTKTDNGQIADGVGDQHPSS